MVHIDAKDVPYKALNEKIRALAAEGEYEVEIDNVCGQKYIGGGLEAKMK